MTPTWYLGPDWDLQPLVCPEPDIEMPVERFGGVFQGLSGARSMTVTGVKERFGFNFRYLEQDEYLRLEALQRRSIPGPHRLINPLRVNRFSPQAAEVKPSPGVVTSNTGLSVWKGSLVQTLDWPADAGPLGALSTKWTVSVASGNYARFDSAFRFPVFPLETLVVSLYMKTPVAGATVTFTYDWFDKTGVQIGSSTGVATLQANWMRYWLSKTAPVGACSVRLALTHPSSSLVGSYVQMAAAQAEAGVTPTPWTPGGGAPRVLIDQLETTSPRYPYTNTTLTLLEA